MSVSVAVLTKQALALSTAEREQLATSLLESTHHADLSDNDQAWLSLAEERFLRMQSGHDEGIPEANFFAKVSDKVAWK